MAETPLHVKLEGDSFITFLVGPDKVAFCVHQNLLFDASPVFKAAFSGSFKEASKRSMLLPDDDKDSVGRMIQWLYTKKFGLIFPICEKTSAECYMQLARLNTLADKYDMYQLKNDIVDDLFDLSKSPRNILPPQMPVVKYVYNNTTAESSFRKLLVAWYVYGVDGAWYSWETTRDQIACVSQDFAVDLAIAIGIKQHNPKKRNPSTLPSSTFHEAPGKVAKENHT